MGSDTIVVLCVLSFLAVFSATIYLSVLSATPIFAAVDYLDPDVVNSSANREIEFRNCPHSLNRWTWQRRTWNGMTPLQGRIVTYGNKARCQGFKKSSGSKYDHGKRQDRFSAFCLYNYDVLKPLTQMEISCVAFGWLIPFALLPFVIYVSSDDSDEIDISLASVCFGIFFVLALTGGVLCLSVENKLNEVDLAIPSYNSTKIICDNLRYQRYERSGYFAVGLLYIVSMFVVTVVFFHVLLSSRWKTNERNSQTNQTIEMKGNEAFGLKSSA